jgi:predicted nucleic acid-binding protein
VNGYLLDTNVISEIRKGTRANPKVIEWYQDLDFLQIYLSVFVLGEVRNGIESCRGRDPVKAARLELWLRGLERQFGAQILPVSSKIADQWGRFMSMRPIGFVNGVLAATALVHGLTLVTRNVQDVQHTGVALLNPF